MRLLISLNRKSKRTVILITHNPDYLVYADRTFFVRDGKIVNVEVNANAKTEVVKSSESEPKKKETAKSKIVSEKSKAENVTEIETDELPEEAGAIDETLKEKKPVKKIKPMRLGK
jgi:ABC-type multidrug transport system ATPase subunit